MRNEQHTLHEKRIKQWQQNTPALLSKKNILLIVVAVLVVLVLVLVLVLILSNNTINYVGNYINGNYNIKLGDKGDFTANMPQGTFFEGDYEIIATVVLTYDNGTIEYGRLTNDSFTLLPDWEVEEEQPQITLNKHNRHFELAQRKLQLNKDGSFTASFCGNTQSGNFKGTYYLREGGITYFYNETYTAQGNIVNGELTMPTAWQDSTAIITETFKKTK